MAWQHRPLTDVQQLAAEFLRAMIRRRLPGVSVQIEPIAGKIGFAARQIGFVHSVGLPRTPATPEEFRAACDHAVEIIFAAWTIENEDKPKRRIAA